MKIEINMETFIDLCPYCLGTGKLKAMQSAMIYEGVSVRVNDTKVKCDKCNGTGLKQHK